MESTRKRGLIGTPLKKKLKFVPLLLLINFHWTQSVAQLESTCFDFSKKVTEPLKQPIPFKEKMNPITAQSETDEQIRWAALRGLIDQPIESVLQKILDPKNIKGPRNKNVEVSEHKQPSYFAFRTVAMTVHPILFLTLSWKEEWAYTLLEGTEKEPQKVLVSYQKTSGTSHIDRFCGSILLKKLTHKKSDIFLYEELKATRRSSQDILNGHMGTLKMLQE